MPCPYPRSRSLHRLGGTRELAQEAKIVAGERAHIVDTGTHHRHTFDTEPEGKSAVDVRVVADRAQDIGMDHAGASHLQPATPLADPAAGTAADGAIDREVNSRLDEWKKVAAEADAPFLSEELPGQLGQGS